VRPAVLSRTCGNCGASGYGPEARYCQMCGTLLPLRENADAGPPDSG
jgi:voltage-gated potassium channel